MLELKIEVSQQLGRWAHQQARVSSFLGRAARSLDEHSATLCRRWIAGLASLVQRSLQSSTLNTTGEITDLYKLSAGPRRIGGDC